MSMAHVDGRVPDKKLAAVCGLFCPACRVFIGTQEDPERLDKLAEQFRYPVEEMKCDGCRSDKRGPYCKICKMAVCAAEKGIDFCGECEEYPCEDLKKFQAAMPHRIELWSAQERIKEIGYERWFTEMLEEYSCPQCGTLNSAYDLTCRECGYEPSCEYVRRHGEAVVRHLAKQG
jgi:hypothetical protein